LRAVNGSLDERQAQAAGSACAAQRRCLRRAGELQVRAQVTIDNWESEESPDGNQGTYGRNHEHHSDLQFGVLGGFCALVG
jgi:hypothetical protein